MLDYTRMDELVAHHHQDLQREAAHRRLIKQALAYKKANAPQSGLKHLLSRVLAPLNARQAEAPAVDTRRITRELDVIDLRC